ncbi:MAG: Nif3-like dinuclear metal center hexameric protein [Puniceicoccales bacterium]|jgi:dinuclear metal center YbgI/SA1388 family protein|nr:Nif3-like dinuclear metal center hexameric protein [Puniceicoccales bacterium]
MVQLSDIVAFCTELLRPEQFSDYPGSYNGLQVQNGGTVYKIAAAVDGNLATIRGAIATGANLLFVHHGLFWGKPLPLTGRNFEKIRLLIENDLALYSCHLPLDGHPQIGNNASILAKLEFPKCGEIDSGGHNFTLPIGDGGRVERDVFRRKLLTFFPQTIAMEYGSAKIGRLLVCSGGGGELIAGLEGGTFDSVLTGEAPRHFFDFVLENGLNAYICGHYATETFGVKNLAEAVAEKFSFPCQWINEDCPL